jgi:hypothetical protein
VKTFGMHHQCSILQQAEYKKNIKTMNFKGYKESIAHIPIFQLSCFVNIMQKVTNYGVKLQSARNINRSNVRAYQNWVNEA